MTFYQELLLVLGTAHTLFAIVAVSFVLRSRRGFPSTSGWFVTILGTPLIGSIAYFCLANPRIKRAQRRRLAVSRRIREFVRGETAARQRFLASELSAPIRSVFRVATHLTGMAPTGGNRLDLLTSDTNAFNRLEGVVRKARKFVWVEYYIINNDETGRRFIDLLTELAESGIEVKLLFDAVGSARIDRACLQRLRAAGGKVGEFLPVNPLRRRWAVHLRNHRKIVIVDGETGFIGGMNIGDEYSGRASWRKAKPWRDSHLSVQGPAVRDLAEIFVEDWSFATYETLVLPPPVEKAPRRGGSIVVAIPSGPDQENNATGLVYFTGIASAMNRCYITSPYFIPDDPTRQAMISAALRGVDIRLLVPRTNDVPLMAMAMRAYYPPLLQAGVRIFEYLPRMLHAKTMAVDSAWGLIGSANLDMRSFRLNFEASVLAYDPAFATKLERQFIADQDCSHEVTREEIARGTLLSAISEGAAQLLSPLL